MQTKLPWVIALLAVVGLGLVGTRYLSKRTQVDNLVAANRKLVSEANDRVTDLNAKLEASQKALAEATERLKGPAARPVAPAAAQMSFTDMSKDPAFVAIWRKQQVRNVLRQYADVLPRLHLGADQQSKLVDLIVDREAAQLTAREDAVKAGASAAGGQERVRKAASDGNEKIKAFLGNDAFAQLLELSEVVQVKILIAAQLAVDMQVAGLPLTADQTFGLAAIFRDVQVKHQDLVAAGLQVPDPKTGLTALNQIMLDKAAAVLSPAQINVLREFFTDQIAQQQYLLKRQAAAHPAAPPTGITLPAALAPNAAGAAH